jgi:hypothetical protein
MSATQLKPIHAYTLRTTLEAALDCPVTLEPAPPVATNASTCAAAIYVSNPLVTQGVIVTDLPLAASLGAAFVRVPTNVVDETVAKRFLPAVIESALNDVFCELTGLFSTRETPTRLYQCIVPGDPMPTDVIVRAAQPVRRLDLRVRPHGYRGGLMSFLRG